MLDVPPVFQWYTLFALVGQAKEAIHQVFDGTVPQYHLPHAQNLRVKTNSPSATTKEQQCEKSRTSLGNIRHGDIAHIEETD